MLQMITAGESHGVGLVVVLEGMPAGLKVDIRRVNGELKRRQQGFGRGGRMALEFDTVEVLAGLRNAVTLGSPIAFFIKNKDCTINPVGKDALKRLSIPRPGHADFAGMIKFNHTDIRNVLERASARETAARVAGGAVCKQLLSLFGIEIISYLIQIGPVKADLTDMSYKTRVKKAQGSEVFCPDRIASDKIKQVIIEAKQQGDSLGGVFEVVVLGAPIGLGGYQTYSDRLDGRIAGAIMSIPALKGVEIGLGFEAAARFGSAVHDPFVVKNRKITRACNNAGGIEAGISNGEPIVVRAAMKPIATLYNPLKSVNIRTKKSTRASVERSDICAVPAASVVAEHMVAFELAKSFLERYGGDSIQGIKYRFSQESSGI